ncbi:MAG TPA: hypothetical protein VJV39_09105, partial [Dongiaceae bacterium]|nr:hypothetical protein [Dongiaceae bacterium]
AEAYKGWAEATINMGISQSANASGGSGATAVNSLVNERDLSIVAAATAKASAYASAEGTIANTGIYQSAYAHSLDNQANATNTLTNNGSLLILAHAIASAHGTTAFGQETQGGFATANARINHGIIQSAYATAYGLQTRTEFAEPDVGDPPVPDGFVYAGHASASNNLTNTGSLTVAALAHADGTGARATGEITETAIGQYASAFGGTAADAANVITNSGDIAIVGAGTAIAQGGNAHAEGHVDRGIYQEADANVSANFEFIFTQPLSQSGETFVGNAIVDNGPANASADLTNTGNILISAHASALANQTEGDAYAAAYIGTGIYQDVYAGGTEGTGQANIVNDDTITINAYANAVGTNDEAYAEITEYGIGQEARGYDHGLASLDNNGTITIVADANVAGIEANFAHAYALIQTGISQYASAHGIGGAATNTIVNDGFILIQADASDPIGARASEGSARATALIFHGITQEATGQATAHSIITNNGTLSIIAGATATADENANARAVIFDAISQDAHANSEFGSALASLDNVGDLNILAIAKGGGGHDISMEAHVDDIYQRAVGPHDGSAIARLTNSGSLVMSAIATGVGGGDGHAHATAGGVSQYASAGSEATASFVNTGGYRVSADAEVAVGNLFHKGADANATARASGVSQEAFAHTFASTRTTAYTGELFDSETAVVSESIRDDVDFTITGHRTRTASGDAQATLHNSTSFVVTANAQAFSDDIAYAQAYVQGIFQRAVGRNATADVTNSDVMLFSANASVPGEFDTADGVVQGHANGADAIANADGITQIAFATNYAGTFVQHGTTDLHYVGPHATFEHGSHTSLGEFNATEEFAVTEQTANWTFTPAGRALAQVVNTGTILVTAHADAIVAAGAANTIATTEGAFARAVASGISQEAHGGTASAIVENTGSLGVGGYLAVMATASASGVTEASANASAFGIDQHASADSFRGSFHSQVLNFPVCQESPLGCHETAIVEGMRRTELAFGQTAAGHALASVTNTGSLTVSALAHATGGTHATAFAFASGIQQDATGATASAIVDNSGSFRVQGVATATAAHNAASASAFATGVSQGAHAFDKNTTFSYHYPSTVGGLGQTTTAVASDYVVDGKSHVSLTNSGSFSVLAHAEAVGETLAYAAAYAIGANQLAVGTEASAAVVNNANMNIDAIAHASGSEATANASATGVNQTAYAVNYHFDGHVATSETSFGGTAHFFTGIGTSAAAAGGHAKVSFTNSGTFHVNAFASATGVSDASASAYAAGVRQRVAGEDWEATFLNSGSFVVHADALADANGATGSANAVASATGYQLVASGGTLNYTNSNLFQVAGTAVAHGTTGLAFAHAVGADISVVGVGTPTPVGGDLNGSWLNSGNFLVRASASATGGADSSADAHGVIERSGANRSTLTNSGTMDVRAVTKHGGDASATGILVTDNGAGGSLPGDLLTINNDSGKLLAAISGDGGATWKRGMAIDVSLAPNPTVINLLGDNSVYGNIDLAATDVINVDDTLTDASPDTTIFDGIINPEFKPQPGVPYTTNPADPNYQGVDPSPTFDGTLNVLTGGRLLLVDNPAPTNKFYDGPSQAYVNTFNM